MAEGKPRIYLHPDGEWLSIGFADTNDALLRAQGGWRDRKQLAQWVDAIQALLNAEPVPPLPEQDKEGTGL